MNYFETKPPLDAATSSFVSDAAPAAAEGKDVTNCDELLRFQNQFSEYLTDKQQLAINLLLAGEREGKVAENSRPANGLRVRHPHAALRDLAQRF